MVPWRAMRRLRFARLIVAAALCAAFLNAQNNRPLNDLPNPYQHAAGWPQMPEGKKLGASASIEVDRDGKSIWFADRCGQNSCEDSNLPVLLKFDASGKLVKSFGAGTMVFPRGLFVDAEGNVWVADGQGNKQGTKGHQVLKFSPDGKLLLALGKPGVARKGTDTFDQPNDVAVAPNGDIFVADGHAGQTPGAPPDTTARIVKFSKDGKYLKEWGKLGSAPGEFRTPHSLYFDSRGRLLVADRGNNRIQIFDQEGKFLEEWKQFSRVSGLYIDKNDVLYASDSESNTADNPGWKRGIRIGSARDGKVRYFIPQTPEAHPDSVHAGMEGVTADAAGNVYGSNVYSPQYKLMPSWGEIKKYVRK